MFSRSRSNSSVRRYGSMGSATDDSTAVQTGLEADLLISHDDTAEENLWASMLGGSDRIRSLDAFRGLAVVLSIFVVDAGATYSGQVNFAPWNGIHLADIVSPFFLFAVGVSLAISQEPYNKEGSRSLIFWATVKRCVRLFVLGLLIQGVPFGQVYDLNVIRIPGTLQRIAFCQLVVMIMELTLPRRDIGFEDRGYFRLYKRFAWHWFVCAVFVMLYLIFLYATPVPGCSPTGQTTPMCNAAQYWDSAILGNSHLSTTSSIQRLPECSSCSPHLCPIPNAPAWCHTPLDADGVIPSFIAVVTVFLGAFVGHILLDTQDARGTERVRQLGPLAIVCALLGVTLNFAGMPFNRNLFSLSFVLCTGGMAIFTLMLVGLLVDVARAERITAPFIWPGLNAVVVFVGASCLETALSWFCSGAPENNLIVWIRDRVLIDKLGNDGGRLTYAFIKCGFWICLTAYFAYKKWFVKI